MDELELSLALRRKECILNKLLSTCTSGVDTRKQHRAISSLLHYFSFSVTGFLPSGVFESRAMISAFDVVDDAGAGVTAAGDS